MTSMGGFESIASQLAAEGAQIKQPSSTTSSQQITIPDDAMPVSPPCVTAPSISSMPMFEDQNFTVDQLLVQPVTTIQSLSPSFEIFTTANQVLSLDTAWVSFRGLIKRVSNVTQAGALITDFTGTDGNGFIWPEGGFWSLVQNLTIQINGVPLPNYQSGNVISQMYAHAVDLPQTYTGDTTYAYNTQMATLQGAMGGDQFFNMRKQGQVKPFQDFTGITTAPATDVNGQYVYFQVPLKNIWAFYQQPGRLFTNDAKLRLNFVLSGLTINGTQVKTFPQALTGTLPLDLTGTPVTAGTVTVPGMTVFAQPVTVTLTDMHLVLPMYNTKAQLNHQVAALVAERPLSLLMNNVEVFQDTNYQNIDLTDPTNWGKGPYRVMIKGSGYLPHHWIMTPSVTCVWGSLTDAGPTTKWPFNIDNLEWQRTIIVPGMMYPRRIYLGGQPYYDDQVVVQYGTSQVLGAINGWVQAVERRTRKIQQQGNYLDAPDQRWLNGYANATQLNPAQAIDVDSVSKNVTNSLSKQNLGNGLLNWAMGCGMNGMSLSQDPSLDTLADSRIQSFEVETYSMPYWGSMYTGATPDPQIMFTGVDQVWYRSATDTQLAVIRPPKEVTMSVNHCLPYAMMVDYGRGRTTAYSYLQPNMESTTNVPM